MKNRRLKQQFGHYRLLSLLGEGGFSEVYLGEHIYLKTQAAIKILTIPLEQDERSRFLSEARIIAHLDHPHIVRVLDFGLQDRVPFLVLSYAPHGSMRQLYPKGAALPLSTIVDVVRQLASALQYAHSQQLIHGDVKPENILVGRGQEVLLSDFGVAVVASHSLHRSDISGTVAYMSPEQLRGEPCFASDQYALGVVVYEWLCGSRPFIGSFTEIAMQHLHTPPPSLLDRQPELSPAIEQVVLRALAKDPQQRFSNILDFAKTFVAACQPLLDTNGDNIDAGKTVAMQEGAFIAAPSHEQPQQEAVFRFLPFFLPVHRNPYFTGRETLLKRLYGLLREPTSRMNAHLAHAPAVAALCGMGGIGKSQIAAEYAYSYQHEYTAILWARAESHEVLFADFVALAQYMKLADAVAFQPPSQNAASQQAVQAVTDWLAAHAGWLLILDNIEEMSLAYRFVPPVSQGHILLTTRAQSTSTLAPRLDVEKMTIDEGALFLLYRSKMYLPGTQREQISGPDWLEAQDIYHLMDGLPLALDQAGAYIEESGCSLYRYIERFRQQRAMLLELRGEASLLHPEAVSATVLLAINKVEQSNPAAVDLLRLCAFLDSGQVNEELLEAYDLDTLVAALRRYSLIVRSPDESALSLHRLVQAIIYDHMEPDMQCAWAERAVETVSQAFPPGEKVAAWPRCERCMPHVYTCFQHIERWQINSPPAASLLDRAGLYLLTQGLYTQAVRLLQKALRIRETLLPQEQPEQQAMSETINSLACCYLYLGEYAQAGSMFTKALAICETLNGPSHPDVAVILNNLALTHHKCGKYAQAEQCLHQALAIWEQLPQTAHPDFARTLNDMALLHHQQGRWREAEACYRRGLVIWEQALGPSHPDLAVHLNNLAMLYAQQRDYAQADPLFRRALEIRERTLGPDHPITAHSLVYLARSFEYQWRYNEAELCYTQALAIRKRALGPDHPEIAYSLCNLAKLYVSQGKHAQAEPLYRQALAIREQALGSDHPEVASLLQSYAILLVSVKRNDEAIQLARRAKTIHATQHD
ncbi:MAG TPA: FxSxx-COOH system tetratricopeptide repeat protein [Ktedonobacteraceae bacterium]|nr:FxSxx-COOH system tetratricopeptide repeat protein [Ktedonobacteraceae bacterium]